MLDKDLAQITIFDPSILAFPLLFLIRHRTQIFEGGEVLGRRT